MVKKFLDLNMSENKRTTENLNHFSCSICSKWWTIGDAPSERESWYCPWCGEMNDFKKTNSN